MTPERWNIVKSILADCHDQPPAARGDWLHVACGDDPALLHDVRAFLAFEDRLDGFIEAPASADVEGAEAHEIGADEAMVGRRIGRYRLMRLLAEGGMGAVFVAERDEDFEQRVALKLVRRGLATPELIRRFHDERQILARLEHPNIARLLDGGTTDDGDPYFAMELIDGEPIDHHCDRMQLSTRQRLELFLPVCSALALAHQSLVIHRDLKPSNILVDRDGVPKLLDFGIAKLLSPGTAGGQEADRTTHRVLTPRFASPEQLRGGVIGTASDVYSLGVVLFLVATGRLPYILDALDPVEAMLAVCQEEPPLASTVVEGAPENVAETREPAATVRKSLGGDIDAILAKALRKEPRERYASVEHLASDIRCHLEGLPVSAHHGKHWYRARKFIGRHRLGLASLAGIVLLAASFTIALAGQLRVTERARDRAESMSSFLIDLFQTAAPDHPAAEEPSMRDLLDVGREKLEDSLGQDPGVRATLLLKIGEVYSKLGDYDQAAALLGEAVALLEARIEAPDPELASALGSLASVHYETGRFAKAEALWRKSLDLRRQLGDSDDLIKPMNNLAAILLARQAYGEAETIYRESLALRRAAVSASPGDETARRNLATNLRSLATALQATGDLDGAEPLLRESLALRRELFGPESTTVATVMLSLGRLEQARGDLEAAERQIAAGLAIRVRELGEDHLHTALARRDLAAVKLELGRFEEARHLATSALAVLERVRPPDDRNVVRARQLLEAAKDAAVARER